MSTIYEQIKNICEEVKDIKTLTEVKTVKAFIHKSKSDDYFTNANEFVKRKLSGADYKEGVIEVSLKPEVIKTVFGNANFEMTNEVRDNLIFFNSLMIEVSKAKRKSLTAEQKIEAAKAKVKELEIKQQEELEKVKSGRN